MHHRKKYGGAFILSWRMHREWGPRSTAGVNGLWSRSMFIYSFRGLSYTDIRNSLKVHHPYHLIPSFTDSSFIPHCSSPVLDLLNPTVALPYYRTWHSSFIDPTPQSSIVMAEGLHQSKRSARRVQELLALAHMFP